MYKVSSLFGMESVLAISTPANIKFTEIVGSRLTPAAAALLSDFKIFCCY